MRNRKIVHHLWWVVSVSLALAAAPAMAEAADAAPIASTPSAALVIGETFTLDSAALKETRRINVWRPPGSEQDGAAALPMLVMPDGGVGEDFLHVAGLMQVSISNGTMRPFLLVGIENTQRRRDLTGPTQVRSDRKVAPVVGGSATFRTFVRDELIPEVGRRYRVTDEHAIVGESFAGLFVVETLLLEPTLFNTYIAIDPSLWWSGEALIKQTTERLSELPPGRALYLATSGERTITAPVGRFTPLLGETNGPLRWQYQPMPDETHGTIYHPAALAAFRAMFKPADR